MNVAKISGILEGLAVLKYFPSDDGARAALLKIVLAMAASESQVAWLVDRMTNGLYNEWPGPRELRACFCSKFAPWDGQNAYSEVYADGIPSEKPALLEIAGPPLRQLPAGRIVTADTELDGKVLALAASKAMPKVRIGNDKFTRMLQDVVTPPHLREDETRKGEPR